MLAKSLSATNRPSRCSRNSESCKIRGKIATSAVLKTPKTIMSLLLGARRIGQCRAFMMARALTAGTLTHGMPHGIKRERTETQGNSGGTKRFFEQIKKPQLI
jgi:hypothetical protein